MGTGSPLEGGNVTLLFRVPLWRSASLLRLSNGVLSASWHAFDPCNGVASVLGVSEAKLQTELCVPSPFQLHADICVSRSDSTPMLDPTGSEQFRKYGPDNSYLNVRCSAAVPLEESNSVSRRVAGECRSGSTKSTWLRAAEAYSAECFRLL